MDVEDDKKAALLIEPKACYQEVCPSVCRFRLISKLISLIQKSMFQDHGYATRDATKRVLT